MPDREDHQATKKAEIQKRFEEKDKELSANITPCCKCGQVRLFVTDVDPGRVMCFYCLGWMTNTEEKNR